MLEISSVTEESTMAIPHSSDLISLSLAPFKQSLRFYAEVQRSALETFSRLGALSTHPFLSVFGGSIERVRSAPGSERNERPIGAMAAPVTETPTRISKPAAKRAAPVKRRTTAKPAATTKPAATKATAAKPPATTKPAATKATAAKPPATGKPAATKRPTATKPAGAKKAAAKKAAAKKA
jgi:hypothetical protein